MTSSRLSLVRTVTITVDDVEHHGIYFVQNSLVYVRSPLGAKATPAGDSPPETIAKVLLSELVRANAARLGPLIKPNWLWGS